MIFDQLEASVSWRGLRKTRFQENTSHHETKSQSRRHVAAHRTIL